MNMATVKLDSGVTFQTPINNIKFISRNSIIEPVAGADDVRDNFEIDDVVIPVNKPDDGATVIGFEYDEVQGNLVIVEFDDESLGKASYSPEMLMPVTADGEYPDHYDPVSYVKALVEVFGDDDDPTEDNQESGADYVDLYVPETNEDATSIVSVENSGLSKILNALLGYFNLHQELDIDIEWSLHDLMVSRGQLHDELDTENNLDKYISDLKAISKNMRLYLDHISGVIDDWCEHLEQEASDYVEADDDES